MSSGLFKAELTLPNLLATDNKVPADVGKLPWTVDLILSIDASTLLSCPVICPRPPCTVDNLSQIIEESIFNPSGSFKFDALESSAATPGI